MLHLSHLSIINRYQGEPTPILSAITDCETSTDTDTVLLPFQLRRSSDYLPPAEKDEKSESRSAQKPEAKDGSRAGKNGRLRIDPSLGLHQLATIGVQNVAIGCLQNIKKGRVLIMQKRESNALNSRVPSKLEFPLCQ